eukprot:CAMPEP_0180525648 /NCGR_PEP_ID=MMETSP1036_2-20121128/59275_1 /TAXON_ID=632150 /ORGANISM="Azadinium spinosum, Strain 3D9" /LENGTH=395 /DNA_ID=CAMNT_0022538951 /DNA_START=36 /DNA_END=1221 /DNA_ORIENTATION=+
MPSPPIPELTEKQAIQLQEELLEGFTKPEFLMKLYRTWHATEDMMEKYKARQELCLTVQVPVIAKYGFEGSKRGVAQSNHEYGKKYQVHNAEAWVNSILLTWLCTNSLALPIERVLGVPMGSLPDGDGGGDGSGELECSRVINAAYKIGLTDEGDADAIRGIERCRGALALAHQVMYKPFYPELQQAKWLGALGNQSVAKLVKDGDILLHAKEADGGYVVGYIYCTCHSGIEEGGGPYAVIHHIFVLEKHEPGEDALGRSSRSPPAGRAAGGEGPACQCRRVERASHRVVPATGLRCYGGVDQTPQCLVRVGASSLPIDAVTGGQASGATGDFFPLGVEGPGSDAHPRLCPAPLRRVVQLAVLRADAGAAVVKLFNPDGEVHELEDGREVNLTQA